MKRKEAAQRTYNSVDAASGAEGREVDEDNLNGGRDEQEGSTPSTSQTRRNRRGAASATHAGVRRVAPRQVERGQR